MGNPLSFYTMQMRLGQSIPEIMGPCWPPVLRGPIILGTPQAHKIIKEGQFATLIVQTPKPKAPLGLSFGCCFWGPKKANEIIITKFQRYTHTYIFSQKQGSSFTLFSQGYKGLAHPCLEWFIFHSLFQLGFMKYESLWQVGVASWFFCGYSYILVVIL